MVSGAEMEAPRLTLESVEESVRLGRQATFSAGVK